MTSLFTDIHKLFLSWPDTAVMLALLAASITLLIMAFTPGHQVLKAMTLAYIFLP